MAHPLLLLVNMTREPQFAPPAEIQLGALETVVGGDWVPKAIDTVGPAIGWFYGDDWKTAPCITRANFAGGAVGLATTITTTVGGYYLGKKTNKGIVAGLVGGLVADSALYERVRARYMKTCNMK